MVLLAKSVLVVAGLLAALFAAAYWYSSLCAGAGT